MHTLLNGWFNIFLWAKSGYFTEELKALNDGNGMCKISLKVRKKTSQIQSLERQLDEKVAEVSEQVTRVTELEEELTQKSGQLEKLRSEVEDRRKEFDQHKNSADKLRDVHKEQMEEMEKQIELVSV